MKQQRIRRLQVRNIKGIRQVDIATNPHCNELAGENEAGKSSILDAIVYAFCGAKGIKDKVPLRRGESSGEVIAETDDFVIQRVFLEDGKTSVRISGVDGGKYKQGDLDKIWNDFTFDPLAFARMDSDKQLKAFMAIMGSDFESKLKSIDARIKSAFEERTIANRVVAKFGTRPRPEGDRVEPLDVHDLLETIKNAQRHNGEQERKSAAIARKREQIEDLRRQLEEAEAELTMLPEPAAFMDTSAETAQLADAEAINRQAEEWRAYDRWESEKREAEAESNRRDLALSEFRKARSIFIESSKFPIEGVEFSDDGLMVDGLPFAQLSSGRKIRVSAQIGMAASPDLRVMFVRDGSLLDSNAFRDLRQMAIDHEYQLWIETVGAGHDLDAILISDGGLANAEQDEDEDAEEECPI